MTIQWKTKSSQRGREEPQRRRGLETKGTEREREREQSRTNVREKSKVKKKREKINTFPIRWSVETI